MAELQLKKDPELSTPYQHYFAITLQDALALVTHGKHIIPPPNSDIEVPDYQNSDAIIAALKQQGIVLGTEHPIHRVPQEQVDPSTFWDGSVCPLELVLFSFNPTVQQEISSNMGAEPHSGQNEHPYQIKEDPPYRFRHHGDGSLSIWRTLHGSIDSFITTEVSLVHPDNSNGRGTDFRRVTHYGLLHYLKHPEESTGVGLLVTSAIDLPPIILDKFCRGYIYGPRFHREETDLAKTLREIGARNAGPFLSYGNHVLTRAELIMDGLTEEQKRWVIEHLQESLSRLLGIPAVKKAVSALYYIRSASGYADKMKKNFFEGRNPPSVTEKYEPANGISRDMRERFCNAYDSEIEKWEAKRQELITEAAKAIQQDPNLLRALKAI